MAKTAIIIGAGPAGLTAAYELLKKTDIKPVIFEKTDAIGGISKTVNYKGCRMDMGGHRFFSKSAKVTDWWLDFFPLQSAPAKDDIILKRRLPTGEYHKKSDPEISDEVMLYRNRISRIFYLKHFFDYPVSLNINTVLNLGFIRMVKIVLSYIKIRISPLKNEKNLEDFMINRFGRELYITFFKDYTEKLWGVPPKDIPADWGAQRIKGVSITKVILHALKKIFNFKNASTETSLIEQFIYPKFGPGQLWEKAAEKIIELGGELHLNSEVAGFNAGDLHIDSVIINDNNNKKREYKGDFFLSTMPVKDLVLSINDRVPSNIKKIAGNLMYRDFITVGLLINKLKIKNKSKIKTINEIIPDVWIYVQESCVKMGRIQIFNNWSPYMVKDFEHIWLGLEYFADEGDDLWNMPKEDFINMAIDELELIGFIDREDVIDATHVKVPKAYPSYFGEYKNFGQVREYLNKFNNLFLIGRNGMHRYNNMDHSMLTAMAAVENIINNRDDKNNIWSINVEDEYHEIKK